MAFFKRNDGTWFLKSMVARRIFTMFVLSAILPLLTISAVSFFFVGHQLNSQAEKRLQQQCKYNGLQIFERLLAIEGHLTLLSRNFVGGTRDKITTAPFNPITREGSGFRRLFLLSEGRLTPLFDHLADLPYPVLDAANPPKNDDATIRIIHSGENGPSVYMLKRMTSPMPGLVIIAGEIDPIFLWGIGTEGASHPEIELTIISAGGEKLISSFPDFHVDAPYLKEHKQNAFSGKFENHVDGETYINVYWSLFLKHRFSSPDWAIISSQSKASILAPVSSFKSTFFLLVLLTFWIILLFSLRTIRKRTTPIEILKAGALKIAQGEMGYQVKISSGDEFEGLAETFNEMSEKIKQSQALLLRSAKMSTLGQMGAGIVHEIGQPLSAISGYAELLTAGVSPEQNPRYLSIICQQVERLKTIVAKFRSFSRDSQESFGEVDINHILHQTHTLLDHQLKMKQVKVEFAANQKLPRVIGNDDGLQQVFLNLFSNAIDALEKNEKSQRKIDIKTYADDGAVHVEITDNGHGIPKEIQRSVFDPFFTTKGADKGTGLGLAITSSIVQKHKGDIKLRSTDQGTTFLLSFPLPHQGTSAPTEAAPAAEHMTRHSPA